MAVTAALVKELRGRTGLGMMDCKKALIEAGADIDLAIENLRKVSGLKAAKKAGRTAAEGVVAVKIDDAGGCAAVVEVNTETDFATRNEGFISFVDTVVDKAFSEKTATIDTLVDASLESTREELVQKVGENIGVRRVAFVEPEGGIVGAYVHSNNRIAVLVELSAGDADLARDIAMHVAAVNPQVVRGEEMPEELVNKEKDIIKAQTDMEGKPEAIVEKMMVGRINKFLKDNSLVDQAFVKNPEITVGQLAKDAGAEVVSFVRFEVGDGIEKEEQDFAAEVAAQVEASKS